MTDRPAGAGAGAGAEAEAEPFQRLGAVPAIAEGEVHLWRFALDADPARLAALWRLLNADERARAERFIRHEHQERFTVGRGMLRALLAGYLGGRPEDLDVRAAAEGKPWVPGANVHFNLSHSDAVALLAVARGREVGVDVERVEPKRDLPGIARRFFAPDEVARLEALPEADRTGAFFDGWTRKEAYIKAIGRGLGMPLDRFAVSLGPGVEAALLAQHDDPPEVERWCMKAIVLGPSFRAALCVEAPLAGVRLLEPDPRFPL